MVFDRGSGAFDDDDLIISLVLYWLTSSWWWAARSLGRWFARPLGRWVRPLGYREQGSLLEANLIWVLKILLHFELAHSSQNRIDLVRVMAVFMGFSFSDFLSATTLVVVLFKALLSTELHRVLWATDRYDFSAVISAPFLALSGFD